MSYFVVQVYEKHPRIIVTVNTLKEAIHTIEFNYYKIDNYSPLNNNTFRVFYPRYTKSDSVIILARRDDRDLSNILQLFQN